jgi:hypothetical protein
LEGSGECQQPTSPRRTGCTSPSPWSTPRMCGCNLAPGGHMGLRISRTFRTKNLFLFGASVSPLSLIVAPSRSRFFFPFSFSAFFLAFSASFFLFSSASRFFSAAS